MADDVRVQNWPADASKERVAYDLMRLCADREGWEGMDTRADVLKLYAECLNTVYQRGYKPS